MQLETVSCVPTSTIQNILSNLSDIKELSKPLIYSAIKSVTKKHDLENAIAEEICNAAVNEDLFFQLTSPGTVSNKHKGELSTRKLRKKYVRENLDYVPPIEIELGYRDGKLRKFAYIPILSVLRNLLRKGDLLQAVLTDIPPSSDNFRSYFDGRFCKSNSLHQEHSTVLLLGIYQDDFEVANPLGTSRKIHKLCLFYWVLVNQPYHFRSNLQSIHTCILCQTSDVKYFGLNAVLDPLARDIHFLEEKGVYVDLLGTELHGTLAYISADNLGAHFIGGFYENFSTVQYFCRFCTLTLGEFLNSSDPSQLPFELRDKQSYEQHVAQVKEKPDYSKLCGIKSECIFHSYLQYFHVTCGLPPDVAHDLLEGIVPYEIALCLEYFTGSGYFTLDFLNSRLTAFEYKYKDITNKPHELSPCFKSSSTIGGNATENRCLLKLLFIFIGEYVPEECLFWHLLLDLKDIVELCHGSVLSDSDISLLEAKINSHITLFKKCFPNKRLKPKHHFLQHYPYLMRAYGPLVQCSTIRFEAKHSFFKNILRSKKNFKNVCLMLADQHQLSSAYALTSCTFFMPEICHTDLTLVDLEEFPATERISLQQFDVTKLFRSHKITVHGILYKEGLLMAHSVDLLPQFGRIKGIFIYQNLVYFSLNCMSTGFLDHIRMFSIVPNGKNLIISLEKCADYYPLVDYKYCGESVVPLKHFISV